MIDLNIFKYIELKPGTKEPKHNLDTYVKDIDKIQDAAVLVPKDIAVVDFDSNCDIAEKILNIYPTFAVKTQRGIHLYYKLPEKHNIISNQTHITTAIGLEVDYKTGANNKKAMATIKQNGKLREIINNDINRLPFELFPISKTKTPLTNLNEGEGRNSALYKHILNIYEQIKGINDDTVLKISNFINNNVFKNPLKDKELISTIQSVIKKLENKKTIMTISDVYDEEGKVNIHALTEYIYNKFDLKIYQNRFYFKKNNDYVLNESDQLLREINKIIKLKRAQHIELLHQLKLIADIVEYRYFPIKLKNGYLIHGTDIICKDLVFTPFILNVNYKPEAYDSNVDDFLNFLTCGRKDLRMLIEEMLGHVLMTSSFPQKAFFLVANSGSNGKSTFLTMLSNFTGDLSSALALDELQKDINLFTLKDKLVNLGDDIDASYLEKSRVFKTLVAGDEIMAKALYEMPIKLRNIATLIFTSNDMPVFKDKSGGIARRVAIIPCDNKVSTIDVHIDEKLSTDDAKSYLLNLALKGMQRIVNNGGKLTESETVNKAVDAYLTENDSFLSYMDDIGFKIDGNKFATVYERYKFYCEDLGFQPLSKNKIGRRLRDLGFELEQKKTNGVNNKYIKKVSDL